MICSSSGRAYRTSLAPSLLCSSCRTISRRVRPFRLHRRLRPVEALPPHADPRPAPEREPFTLIEAPGISLTAVMVPRAANEDGLPQPEAA
jgi:hypothetical protein